MSDTIKEANETPKAIGQKLAVWAVDHSNRHVAAGLIKDFDKERNHAVLECADGTHEIVDFPEGLASHMVIGDYFVIDKSGTETVCAASAFWATHHRIV